MDYEEALKKVREEKPKDNYIVIKLGYELHLVLPHKDGMAFLDSLKAAEQFDKSYGANRIEPLGREKLEIQPMSRKEYERYKIAAVLNLTVDEVKQIEDAKPTTESPPT